MNRWFLVVFVTLLLSACSDEAEVNAPVKLDKTVSAEVKVLKEALPKAKPVEANIGDESYKFVQLTERELENNFSVESSRTYAVYGFNRPAVVLNFPKNENSQFAKVTFEDIKMVDASGDEVDFELIRGLYRPEDFSNGIRFANKKDPEALIEFSRVTGNVVIDYPLAMSVEKFRQNGSKRGVNVTISANGVEVKSDFSQVAGKAGFFLTRSPVSVFNDKGELLEPKSGQPSWPVNGEMKLSFDQTPAEVHIAFTDKSHRMTLPYDLKPAALLPENTKGLNPKEN